MCMNTCTTTINLFIGGSTGIMADDVLCIIKYNCNTSLRNDTCGICDDQQYKYNSRYKDCTGKCYKKGIYM